MLNDLIHGTRPTQSFGSGALPPSWPGLGVECDGRLRQPSQRHAFDARLRPRREDARDFEVADEYDQAESQRDSAAQKGDPTHQLFFALGNEHEQQREHRRREGQGGHPKQIGFHGRYFPVTIFTK